MQNRFDLERRNFVW